MEARLIVQFGQHRTAEHMVVGTDSVNGTSQSGPGFRSVRALTTCTTQSVRVERANWNGEHTSSTSFTNCRAKLFETNRLKEVLVAISRIPPSGFINVVMVA